jgi:hypothetical protein
VSVQHGGEIVDVMHAPRCVAIECKTGKKKLKPGQERFRETWAGEYVVLRSVDDVLALNNGENL